MRFLEKKFDFHSKCTGKPLEGFFFFIIRGMLCKIYAVKAFSDSSVGQ